MPARYLCRNQTPDFYFGEGKRLDLQRIQKEINEKDRLKFIDFLICMAYVANVSNDTVHATMHIVDRYLSVKSLKRRKIMAFEFACLIIASKMYEVDGEAPLAA